MNTALSLKFWHRFYSDFIMPSRLREYRTLIKNAIDAGFDICPIGRFWDMIRSNSVDAQTKYLILRHDIDTDVPTARLLWQAEQSLNVSGSYYFRLSTFDIDLMREIEDKGGEASYHYEEIAAAALQKGLRNKEQVIAELPNIRQTFMTNLGRLRNESGLPLKIVAAHGHFINREIGISGKVLLQDREFRAAAGIDLEVYDRDFMIHVNGRYSDTHYPAFWKPSSLTEAIRSQRRILYVIIHPRHWRANIAVNIADNITRFREAVLYGFHKMRG